MRKFFLIFLFISVRAVAADSVKVDTKKYIAPFNGIKIQDTAVYNLPVITAGAQTSVMQKLNSYLVSDSILTDNIDSIMNNYKKWRAGIVGSGYNVLYNKNSVLSISVYIETLGAYPDISYTDVNLNLNTGERILITDIIKENSFEPLTAMLDSIVQERIKKKVQEYPSDAEDLREYFVNGKFTAENLSNFAFKDEGIVFYYDFGLPHALKALSPDEDILIPWNVIAVYVKENNLLNKIINK